MHKHQHVIFRPLKHTKKSKRLFKNVRLPHTFFKTGPVSQLHNVCWKGLVNSFGTDFLSSVSTLL